MAVEMETNEYLLELEVTDILAKGGGKRGIRMILFPLKEITVNGTCSGKTWSAVMGITTLCLPT